MFSRARNHLLSFRSFFPSLTPDLELSLFICARRERKGSAQRVMSKLPCGQERNSTLVCDKIDDSNAS